eukprot:scaffold17499_cov71-Phaeocystis_antarctica.AAC.1
MEHLAAHQRELQSADYGVAPAVAVDAVAAPHGSAKVAAAPVGLAPATRVGCGSPNNRPHG